MLSADPNNRPEAEKVEGASIAKTAACPLVFLSTRRQLIGFSPLQLRFRIFLCFFRLRPRLPLACIYHFGSALSSRRIENDN